MTLVILLTQLKVYFKEQKKFSCGIKWFLSKKDFLPVCPGLWNQQHKPVREKTKINFLHHFFLLSKINRHFNWYLSLSLCHFYASFRHTIFFFSTFVQFDIVAILALQIKPKWAQYLQALPYLIHFIYFKLSQNAFMHVIFKMLAKHFIARISKERTSRGIAI